MRRILPFCPSLPDPQKLNQAGKHSKTDIFSLAIFKGEGMNDL